MLNIDNYYDANLLAHSSRLSFSLTRLRIYLGITLLDNSKSTKSPTHSSFVLGKSTSSEARGQSKLNIPNHLCPALDETKETEKLYVSNYFSPHI